ncbi:MAG: DNA-3-methyladenine glycosylase [Planctomycetota bacterium]
MHHIPRNKLKQSTEEVAKFLLGKILRSDLGKKSVSGRIVETEAYLPSRDSACHANKYRTRRTEVMFGEAGTAYVYPIHAKHCFNIVTEQLGKGCAVLIRALEPITGIETMQARRNLDDIKRLTTGPGCLCQALGIDKNQTGIDLCDEQSPVRICDPAEELEFQIGTSVRIGVTSAKKRKLRFFVLGNSFVSGSKKLNTAS